MIYLNNFIVSRFGLLSLSKLGFNFLSRSNISDDNKNVFEPSTKVPFAIQNLHIVWWIYCVLFANQAFNFKVTFTFTVTIKRILKKWRSIINGYPKKFFKDLFFRYILVFVKAVTKKLWKAFVVPKKHVEKFWNGRTYDSTFLKQFCQWPS